MYRFIIDSMNNGTYAILSFEELTRKRFRNICKMMCGCMRHNEFFMCYCTIEHNGKEKLMGLIAHKVKDMYFVYYKGICVYEEKIVKER